MVYSSCENSKIQVKNKTTTIITRSADQTESAGEAFASQVKSGDIICLYGELGAGKTTFVRGFVRGLGFEDRVMSPTFTIIRTYHKNGDRELRCYHIDLYRIEDGKSNVQSLGIEDIFADKNAIVLIEWPERMKELLPEKRWDVIFNVTGDSERLVKYINNE